MSLRDLPYHDYVIDPAVNPENTAFVITYAETTITVPITDVTKMSFAFSTFFGSPAAVIQSTPAYTVSAKKIVPTMPKTGAMMYVPMKDGSDVGVFGPNEFSAVVFSPDASAQSANITRGNTSAAKIPRIANSFRIVRGSESTPGRAAWENDGGASLSRGRTND